MEHTIGKRISFHRKRLGLTQEQLAQRLGVSAQAVSKWENDQSCPDISLLPELAKIFGVTVDELLGGQTQGVHVAEPIAEEPEQKPERTWHFEFGNSKGAVASTLWFAGFLLLVGGLLLTAHFLKLDISWWTVTWTSAGVIFGLSQFFGSWSIGGLMIALAGAYFELSAFGVIHFDLGWGVVLPILLIALALSLVCDLLLKRRRAGRVAAARSEKKLAYHVSCDDGELDCEMAFGDARAQVNTDCLNGGSIETNFGDFVVDFSGVEAVSPNCRIDVEANFGNLTLMVPARYRVALEQGGKFSAAHTHGSPNEICDGVISLTSEVNFGALEIQYI